jgi:hypothetical protein
MALTADFQVEKRVEIIQLKKTSTIGYLLIIRI